MLRLIACAILALACVGCSGTRTRINHGADLAVYVGSAQYMFDRMPNGVIKANAVNEGFYDPADGSITMSEQLHGWLLVRRSFHELGHAADHQKPRDMWELMARYESPSFSFNFHSDESIARGRSYMATIPDPLAVQQALAAARTAAEAGE